MYKNLQILIFTFFFLLPSLSYSYSISLKKGWNLMGFNEKIDATKLLSSSTNISSLWVYDKKTSSWVYTDKTTKTNANPLIKSSANAGMWITVDNDMTINMEDYFLSDTDNANTRNYVKSKMITKNRSYFGVRGR